ncbi:MAG: biotin--[acetyl-CoA-carboxylase] ligase [Treponemataceae bacterium]|nr:biotin--[acetyl-CoA-carboxylase] ligase [Treponemataceae bacterium]
MSTKSAVFSALVASTDFVSGEELAAACGVSRTSVWKAITALRADGCQIEAVSNRGYRLISAPDKIDGAYIARRLTELGARPGAVFCFDEIDSTLAESKRQCAAVGVFRDAHGELTADGARLHRALIVAGKQTAGRGRMGRPFASPPDSGVYFTLIYAPKNGVTNPALLTAAAAVAVARAADELFGTHAQIIWVNDVFLGGKKICGILTEGVANFESGQIEAANVGIGINVRDGGFPGELAAVAGSLQEFAPDKEKAARVSRNEVVARVAAHLLSFYDAGERGNVAATAALMAEYRARSFVIGKTVTVNPAAGLRGEPYQATVLDISDDAGLVVRCADGTEKTLQSGEVSLHGTDFAQ